MQVNYHNEQIPFVVVDSLYNNEEESEIMMELDYLSHSRRLIPPFEDGLAATRNNKNIKNVGCLYLDHFFGNRDTSSILSITEKLFFDDSSLINNHPHWYFDATDINSHFTHMLYYENTNEYPPHNDTCRMTALTYFYKKPKSFSGGNLLFSDFDIEVECLNNRTIIFPSILQHASTPIIMNEEHQNKKLGKYCITQFLSRKSENGYDDI